MNHSQENRSQILKVEQKQSYLSFISDDKLSKMILMPGCGVFWVLGFIYANQHKISPIEVHYTRYIVQTIISFFSIYYWKQNINYLNHKEYKMLLIRSLLSSLNGVMASIFQLYLPLPVYYTINSSTTIFTFVLNHLLYHMKISNRQIKSVLVSLIGIFFVINGRAIYAYLDSSYVFHSQFKYQTQDNISIILAGIGVFLWSILWAYAIVITSKTHASFQEFMFMNSIVGLFTLSFLQTMLEPAKDGTQKIFLFITKPQYLFKAAIYCGIPLTLATYIFNLGLMLSKNTGVSTMITQINIAYVYFISLLHYKEEINIICFLGTLMLVGSIYSVLIYKK